MREYRNRFGKQFSTFTLPLINAQKCACPWWNSNPRPSALMAECSNHWAAQVRPLRAWTVSLSKTHNTQGVCVYRPYMCTGRTAPEYMYRPVETNGPAQHKTFIGMKKENLEYMREYTDRNSTNAYVQIVPTSSLNINTDSLALKILPNN